MDGHQLRGARIHRDMMLVSSVCRRALGCEWEGGTRGQDNLPLSLHNSHLHARRHASFIDHPDHLALHPASVVRWKCRAVLYSSARAGRAWP